MDELASNFSICLKQLHILILNYETSQILAEADALESERKLKIGFTSLFLNVLGFDVHPNDFEDELRAAAVLSLGPCHNVHDLATEAQWAHVGRHLALEKLGEVGGQIGKRLHSNLNKLGKSKPTYETSAFKRAVVLAVLRRNSFFSAFSKEEVFHLFWDQKVGLDTSGEEAMQKVAEWAALGQPTSKRDIIQFGKTASRGTLKHEADAELFVNRFS